jgi:histidine ammonia-lyase
VSLPCTGVGRPLSLDRTRRLLALRINVLAKGHSGVRPETVERMLAFLNNDCLPLVPEQGSVGASGDLAPLCASPVAALFVLYCSPRVCACACV